MMHCARTWPFSFPFIETLDCVHDALREDLAVFVSIRRDSRLHVVVGWPGALCVVSIHSLRRADRMAPLLSDSPRE
jgi:hypothetical protein